MAEFIPNLFNYRDDVFVMESGYGFHDEIFHITIGPFLTREEAVWAQEQHELLSKDLDEIDQTVIVDEITHLLMQYVHTLTEPKFI